MCNKALSKCRLLQKNCKKILWHEDGVEGGKLISPESDAPHFHLQMFTATACHQPTTKDMQPILHDSAGQQGSDLPSCYLNFFFQNTCGKHPFYSSTPRLQKRCLPCLPLCVINLWLKRHAAESGFIF